MSETVKEVVTKRGRRGVRVSRVVRTTSKRSSSKRRNRSQGRNKKKGPPQPPNQQRKVGKVVRVKSQQSPRKVIPYTSELKRVASRYISSAPKLKAEEKSILKNIMLPYLGKANRVSPPGDVLAPPKTALARHNFVVDFNLQKLLEVSDDDLGLLPELDVGLHVWDVPNNVSLILLQDLYVPLIYPSYNGVETGEYSCVVFANENATYGNTPYLETEAVPGVTHTQVTWELEPVSFGRYSVSPAWPLTKPCHSLHDGRYVWIDANHNRPSRVTFTVTPRFTSEVQSNSLYASAYILTPGTYGRSSADETGVFNGALPNQDSICQLDISKSGYYRFKIDGMVDHAANDSVRCTVALDLEMRTSVNSWHYVNTQVEGLGVRHGDFYPMFDHVQILGTSLLWQNTAPLIMKGGATTGSAWSGNEPWWEISGADTARVTSKNIVGVYTGLWEDGMYGYIKPITYGFDRFTNKVDNAEAPDTAATFVVTNITESVDPVGPNPKIPSCRGMSLFRVQPPMVAANQPSLGSALSRLVITISFEFSSYSQNFNLEVPKIGPTVFLETQRKFVGPLIPFDKNSTHEKDIWSLIKGFAYDVGDSIGAVKGLFDIGSKYFNLLFG